jgi:serine/threonine protein kinase
MYVAPEQALGQPLDQRADLFSLGSVLYQMVTGRPPFRATTAVAVLKRVAEDQPQAIREINPKRRCLQAGFWPRNVSSKRDAAVRHHPAWSRE